jgi:F-box protein 11
VHVTQGANPLVRRCKVRNGREVGVLVDDGGRGAFEDCDVVNNQFQGVLVTGGETQLQRCRVQRNMYGVWVEGGGAATVEGCTLTLNREGAWRVKAGATVRQRGNKV